MSLQVQLDRFEGPFSLLLYLIKKDELDIYDIPIHEITKQYLDYIQIMKEFNLEVAGEFIAMASTLIYIKSRMLVPQYDEHGEVVADDPRKDLVQKLVEYQRYQEAGKQLYKRPLVGRDTWLRGTKDELPKGQDEIILDEKGLFALITSFRQLMKEAKKSTHQVTGKGQSISANLVKIKDRFVVGQRLEIRDLLPESFTKVDLIITFLSILELARLRYIRVYQTEPYAPLYIDTLKIVSADAVSHVQEFDSREAQATADSIMARAQEQLSQVSLSEEASSQIDQENLSEDIEVQAVEAGELV